MNSKFKLRWIVLFLLAGIGCLVFAYTQFSALSALEAKGGALRLHSIEALLYRNLGKFGVLGFYLAGGVLCLGLGMVLLRRRLRSG